MKAFLLGCSLAVALPGVAQHPRPVGKVNQALHAPASAYDQLLDLSKEVVQQLRRALAEPNDTKAQAMLKSPKVMHMLKRRQQLKPALDRWLRSLSLEQKDTLYQQFVQGNQLIQYIDSLEKDSKSKRRFMRSPSLKSTVEEVVYRTIAD